MEKKELLRSAFIGLVIGAGIPLLVILLLDTELIDKAFSIDSAPIFLASVLLSLFLALFIHELGHLLLGLIQGFRTELFVVGFFGVHRKENRLKVFFNKDLQYFGGIAATTPTKTYPDIRKRYAFILGAGPGFSLLFGFAFLTLFVFQDSAWNALFALTGIFSLMMFLATVLPNKSGTFFTDRKRLQRLLSSGLEGQVEAALLETMNQQVIDGHCRNLVQDKLDLIKLDSDPTIQFWGYFWEYHQGKELGLPEDPSLREKVLSYESHFPKAFWRSLESEPSDG